MLCHGKGCLKIGTVWWERLLAAKLTTSDDSDSVTLSNPPEWLEKEPWAARIEVTRDFVAGKGVYVLRARVEKCIEPGCSKFLRAFYRNTPVKYEASARAPELVPIVLRINRSTKGRIQHERTNCKPHISCVRILDTTGLDHKSNFRRRT